MTGKRIVVRRMSDVTPKPPPSCPGCGEPMSHYGGSAGYIHCGWKLLYRQGGWFDERGLHVWDDRLAGGSRRIDGDVEYYEPKARKGGTA